MANKSGRHSFVHDALVLIKNRFMVMALSFVTGVILARCLGPSGKGIIAGIMVYPALFISVAELGVRQSAVYYIGKKIYTNAQVISNVTALIMITSLFGVLICFLLLVVMNNPNYTPLLIAFAVSVIPLRIVASYSSGILLGNRLVGQFAVINRMVEVQRLFAVLIFVWFLGWGVAGAMFASLLSGVVVSCYAVWRVSQIEALRPSFNRTIVSDLLSKGVVYALSLFVVALNYKVNTIMLERMSTAAELGVFSVGVGIAQLTWALPQSITTALFSHSATVSDEFAFSTKVARLFRVTLVVALGIVAALALLTPVLIPFVYGEEFRPTVRVIHLLLPGVFFFLGLKALNSDLAGRGRPNAVLWIMVPTLAVNATCSIFLVPRYGAQGAAVASSIANTLGGIGMMVMYVRITGMGFSGLLRYRFSDFSFKKYLSR